MQVNENFLKEKKLKLLALSSLKIEIETRLYADNIQE